MGNCVVDPLEIWHAGHAWKMSVLFTDFKFMYWECLKLIVTNMKARLFKLGKFTLMPTVNLSIKCVWSNALHTNLGICTSLLALVMYGSFLSLGGTYQPTLIVLILSLIGFSVILSRKFFLLFLIYIIYTSVWAILYLIMCDGLIHINDLW